jgi:hypothetical protein
MKLSQHLLQEHTLFKLGELKEVQMEILAVMVVMLKVQLI